MNLSTIPISNELRGFEDWLNKLEQFKELQSSNWNFKTFNIKCENSLSRDAKLILQNLKRKWFYSANDDLLYLLKRNSLEQDLFLRILHSMAISLQNTACASFFDIYIWDINIEEVPKFKKFNRFVNQKSTTIKPQCSITFTLVYQLKPLPKEPEIPW